jgi:hypothetical protein
MSYVVEWVMACHSDSNCGGKDMSKVINLDHYKDSFRDSDSFKTFTEVLRQAASNNSVLLCGTDVFGELISPQEAEQRLKTKIIRSLSKEPRLLDKLQASLEDEIVE